MPLTGYRILQQGSGVALDYCGKIFADFGADVVKLEPLGGDPLRTMPPVLANGESGLFAWLNTNKKSVTETPANLDALLPGADVLLTERTRPDLTARYPGLAVTAIDWFGENGPYSNFAGTESIARALAGLVALTGP
ncbi:MAG: CoA transferase, partial [Rhodospirillales bacterium]